jgi:hypothetical protein
MRVLTRYFLRTVEGAQTVKYIPRYESMLKLVI